MGWSIPALCSCPAAPCQDQAGWRWASVTHYPCSHPDDTFIASRTGLLPAQQPHGSEAGKRAGEEPSSTLPSCSTRHAPASGLAVPGPWQQMPLKCSLLSEKSDSASCAKS